MKYFFDKDSVTDFSALCERFAGKPLQSPYRSTVPLLSLVEHSRSEWHALLELLGAPRDSTVHFEYCVPSPKAGGNPSQTDALIMSESTVWAIEAKWTEPCYETVAKRISKPEADGADPRKTVEGWLNYLRPFAAHDLHLGSFSDTVYQMVHRAASACAVATERRCKPELVYLHFHPSPERKSATTIQYVSDLRHLSSLLGNPVRIGFTVVQMPVKPIPAFNAIKGLNRRQPSTAAKVSAALCEGPLFEFGKPIISEL